MEDIKKRMESRQKREKKNRREMKKKSKIRALQMVSSSGILTDEQQDGLFSLGVIKGSVAGEDTGKKSLALASAGSKAASSVLARVSETSAPGEEDLAMIEADSEAEVSGGGAIDGTASMLLPGPYIFPPPPPG